MTVSFELHYRDTGSSFVPLTQPELLDRRISCKKSGYPLPQYSRPFPMYDIDAVESRDDCIADKPFHCFDRLVTVHSPQIDLIFCLDRINKLMAHRSPVYPWSGRFKPLFRHSHSDS